MVKDGDGDVDEYVKWLPKMLHCNMQQLLRIS